MKDHDLLEAIGGIDEKFIENAKTLGKVRKINYSTFFPVAAACIILAAASGVFIPQMLSDKSGDIRIMSETENEPQKEDTVQILSEPGSDISIATADENADENYADAYEPRENASAVTCSKDRLCDESGQDGRRPPDQFL